jgi:hypothetical protein
MGLKSLDRKLTHLAAGLVIVLAFFFSGCSPGNESTEVKIVGAIFYEDRSFGPKGFTGKVKLPVRNAIVQIVADNDRTVSETSTDAKGNYAVSARVREGKRYYVRCLAESDSGRVSVADTSDNIYAYRGTDFIANGDLQMDLYATGSSAEPFNIYDCIHDGFSYLETLAPLHSLAPLEIVWEENKSTSSFYDKTANAIHLAAVMGVDDDGWDDTVILHEFAHYVAAKFSKDDSPEATHNYQSAIDKRQAWSEGWATFFALKVMAWRGQAAPQHYVDTTGEDLLGPQTVLYTYEIQTPSFPETSFGDSNEISVSAFLWKMAEHITPADNHLGIDSAFIWEIFHSFLPSRSNVSFETFWDGWRSLGYQAIQDIVPLLHERGIEYWPDSYEPNNVMAAAAPYSAAGMHLTFYGEADIDWISFYAQSGVNYSILIHNKNGTNPCLEVYSATGQLLAANDNSGDGAACTDPGYHPSTTSFTPTMTSYCFIKLYSPPSGTSRYGSFDLLIQ